MHNFDFDVIQQCKEMVAKEENKANGGMKKPDVPYGTYEVKIDKLAFGYTQANNPKMEVHFKIVNGQFENCKIYMHQSLHKAFGYYKAIKLLKSLESNVYVDFVEEYPEFEQMLFDIKKDIDGKKEYKLEFKPNDKNSDFNEYNIIKVYDL